MISFCTPYVQPGEERTETGHPDHEVAVILGVLLGIPEDLGVQHVELDVIAVVVKIGLDKIQYVVPALAGLELIRRELSCSCALR